MENSISVLSDRAKNFTAIADLLNHISDPVYIADSENKIVFANDYFCALIKLNQIEVVGKCEEDFFAQRLEQNDSSCAKIFFKSNNDLKVESLKDSSGNKHTIIKLKNHFRHFDGERYVIVSLKNGSDYDGINKYLLHDVEKFGEVNRAKDKFISALSHDIRGPIGSIISSSDLLIDMFDKIDKEEIKKFLQSINRTAKKSFHLLENLKILTELRTGSIKRDLSTENIYDFLEKLFPDESKVSLKFNNGKKKTAPLIEIDQILFQKIFDIVKNLNNGSFDITVKNNSEHIVLDINFEDLADNETNYFHILNKDIFDAASFQRNELSRDLEIHLLKEIVCYHKGNLELISEDEKIVVRISFPNCAERKVF